jgi:hypothetical protein
LSSTSLKDAHGSAGTAILLPFTPLRGHDASR